MLAGASGLLLVTTVLFTTWQVGLAVSDRSLGDGASALAFGGLQATLWKWIGLGAWERARPRVDPDTGEPLPPSEPIGPWGWVGRGLLALLAVVVLGFGAWITVEGRDEAAATERLRGDAERAARRADLTVGDVAASLAPGLDHLARLEELERRLDVDDATVVDASAADGRAAILLRPDGGGSCVALDLDRNDLASTRVVSSC